MTLVAWVNTMRSFWSDPYLWIHVAGIAVLPIALELCLLGFAIGDPFLPAGIELLLVAILGITPVLWMQWQRPFYIFSLLVVALKPEQLTLDQRRLLHWFKTPVSRGLAVLVPVVLSSLLWQIYKLSPIAIESAAFLPQWRGLGLLLAAIAFFLSNLFLQVPISVLRVLLVGEAKFAATTPYGLEQIPQDFSVLGWQVKQILPFTAVSQSEEVTASLPVSPAPDSLNEAIANAFSAESVAPIVPEPAISEPVISEPVTAETLPVIAEIPIANTPTSLDATSTTDTPVQTEVETNAIDSESTPEVNQNSEQDKNRIV
jgi:hypothetical protein